MKNMVDLSLLLTEHGHSDIAIEALKKVAMPRRKKVRAPSKSTVVLMNALETAGAQLEEWYSPRDLEGAVEQAVRHQVDNAIQKISEMKRPKLKVTREDEIQDSYLDDEGYTDVYYSGSAYYPDTITYEVVYSLSPKRFGEWLWEEIESYLTDDSHKLQRKILSDRHLLDYAGKDALKAVIKAVVKLHEIEISVTDPIGTAVKEYAYQKAEHVDVSTQDDDNPGLYAKLKLDVRDPILFLKQGGPWKMKLTALFNVYAQILWPEDPLYDHYL